jgi:MoxR-like ATPase
MVTELEELRKSANRLLDEVEKAVVGKRETLELVLLAIMAGGHVLIEDFPGLANELLPDPVHPGPDALGHHGFLDFQSEHR